MGLQLPAALVEAAAEQWCARYLDPHVVPKNPASRERAVQA